MKMVIFWCFVLFIFLGGTSSVQARNYVIGFSQSDTAESDWRKANTESFREAAKASNITLVFMDAGGKVEVQREQFLKLVEQKVDAIILAAHEVKGWDDVLIKAKEAKIPVVLEDRTIDLKPENKNKGLYVAWIGSNFRNQGRMAAAWLAQDTGGNCNIVEIQGPEGASAAIERGIGFREVLALFPGMKIIATKSGNWREKQGQEVMKEFLTDEGANIRAVFAQNDNMAYGAVQAIEENKELGLKPGTDIRIIGVDATHHGFELLMQKKLNCLVECNPLEGPITLSVVMQILSGRNVPPVIYMEDAVFTQLNANAVFPTRKY